MIYEIGAIGIFIIGILTGEYVASSMALLTLLIFVDVKGGRKE